MRYIFVAVGLILILFAAAKVYLVFHGAKHGTELMTDATLAVLGAIAFFAGSAKIGKKKPD